MAKNKTKKLRGLFINLGVFLAVLIILFIIVEVALRLAVESPKPEYKDHPYYIYTYDPDTTIHPFFIDLNKSFSRSFNNEGWYGPESEYTTEKTKPKRILVIGDSFASQLSLDNYTDIFSERLEQKYKNADVITLGVASYALDNEEKVLEREGPKYKPDLVIFATFINDISPTIRDNIFSLDNGALRDNTPANIPFVRKAVFACQSWSYACGTTINVLLTHGDIVNRVATALGVSNIQFDPTLKQHLWGVPDVMFMDEKQPDSVKLAWTKSDLIVKRIKQVAAENNETVIIALIPIKEQISERKRLEFLRDNPDINATVFKASKPYDDIKAMMEANGLPVIDLASQLKAEDKNNSFYYEIDGHWNEQGHAFVAEAIYNYLNNHSYLKP